MNITQINNTYDDLRRLMEKAIQNNDKILYDMSVEAMKVFEEVYKNELHGNEILSFENNLFFINKDKVLVET